MGAGKIVPRPGPDRVSGARSRVRSQPGWTTIENAESYWSVLSGSVIPGIEAKSIEGYRGIEVLRRDHETEVEFVTMMTFNSIQTVIDFQGEGY
ncbi:MAG: hypothetical protein P8125_06215 [Gemmatimonadota bacterium]